VRNRKEKIVRNCSVDKILFNSLGRNKMGNPNPML